MEDDFQYHQNPNGNEKDARAPLADKSGNCQKQGCVTKVEYSFIGFFGFTHNRSGL